MTSTTTTTTTTPTRVFVGEHWHERGSGPSGSWNHQHGGDAGFVQGDSQVEQHRHEYLPLADQARRDLAAQLADNAAADREAIEQLLEADVQRMAEHAAGVLGHAYMAEVELTAAAIAYDQGTPDWYVDRRTFFAVDGLRFEVELRMPYGDGYPRASLYLLSPCENTTHPPADERIRIEHLTDVARALDAPVSDGAQLPSGHGWRCPACEALRPKPPAPEPAPQPPTPTLVDLLDAFVREIVDEQLADRGVGL